METNTPPPRVEPALVTARVVRLMVGLPRSVEPPGRMIKHRGTSYVIRASLVEWLVEQGLASDHEAAREQIRLAEQNWPNRGRGKGSSRRLVELLAAVRAAKSDPS